MAKRKSSGTSGKARNAYGKSYGSKWKKYLLWYLAIGIIIYLAVYFLYFRGPSGY